MNAVKINRLELLTIVKENATKHLIAYDEAVEDYKKVVLKIATDNLALAQTGDISAFIKMKNNIQAPSNYATSYTRAIRMLELSVDEVIEVEEDVFNQLVLDEWTWKNNFVATGALYKTF
jgi:uncharacterized beta-barrel protein YwiB (DUF1934 family)